MIDKGKFLVFVIVRNVQNCANHQKQKIEKRIQLVNREGNRKKSAKRNDEKQNEGKLRILVWEPTQVEPSTSSLP